jgi:hypothetical protein
MAPTAAAAVMKATWPGPAATAQAEGWADRETLDAMLAEIDAWAEQPDAFWLAVLARAAGSARNRGGVRGDGAVAYPADPATSGWP